MVPVFSLAMGQARFETSFHKKQFNCKQLGIEEFLIAISVRIFFFLNLLTLMTLVNRRVFHMLVSKIYLGFFRILKI